MAGPNAIHVVGTGTIGEPIIGLLARYRLELGIDEVTFYKHSPRKEDLPMVRALRGLGAKLVIADGKAAEWKELGITGDVGFDDAVKQAKVIIDCSPTDQGLANKERLYSKLDDGTKVFMAQGSEDGFGKKVALGINDDAVDPASDKFLHVVSCNTHSLCRLTKVIGGGGDGLDEGRFVLIRRAGDVSDTKFIQAPQVDKHKEDLGTHHATDLADLYKSTLGKELKVFSSALKLNTPYMHTVHFHFRLQEATTLENVVQALGSDRFVGLTEKKATNSVFSFGREHGPFGRILSQTIVVTPSLHVSEDGRDVTGFAFTPQDGNSLLTSMAYAVRAIHPEDWRKRMSVFDGYLLKEY